MLITLGSLSGPFSQALGPAPQGCIVRGCVQYLKGVHPSRRLRIDIYEDQENNQNNENAALPKPLISLEVRASQVNRLLPRASGQRSLALYLVDRIIEGKHNAVQ